MLQSAKVNVCTGKSIISSCWIVPLEKYKDIIELCILEKIIIVSQYPEKSTFLTANLRTRFDAQDIDTNVQTNVARQTKMDKHTYTYILHCRELVNFQHHIEYLLQPVKLYSVLSVYLASLQKILSLLLGIYTKRYLTFLLSSFPLLYTLLIVWLYLDRPQSLFDWYQAGLASYIVTLISEWNLSSYAEYVLYDIGLCTSDFKVNWKISDPSSVSASSHKCSCGAQFRPAFHIHTCHR